MSTNTQNSLLSGGITITQGPTKDGSRYIGGHDRGAGDHPFLTGNFYVFFAFPSTIFNADAQAAQNSSLQQQITKQGQSSNMLALLGLLGSSGQQTQQAVQTPVADIKSFEDLGYGDLFGGKLQFSDGGSVDDLLNLLKG